MLSASWTQAHQSVLGSVGAPRPISDWKALIAVPQRKSAGKGITTFAEAGRATRRKASRSADRMSVGYVSRRARVNANRRE
jgi:hypothetical protein